MLSKKLRLAGIDEATHEGRHQFYRLSGDHVQRLVREP